MVCQNELPDGDRFREILTSSIFTNVTILRFIDADDKSCKRQWTFFEGQVD